MTLRPSRKSPVERPLGPLKELALSAAVSYTIVLAQAIGFVEGVRRRAARDDAERSVNAHRN
jgi:hypothetical protein